MTPPVRLSDEVRAGLADGAPIVALETTLVAHGFPPPSGIDVALESEAAVRAGGALPATVAILDGEIRVGLAPGELDRFTPSARKVGPRDLAVCVAQGATGATTVGGTLAVASTTGIRFMGTGGIGGVHRGFADTLDVSADLATIARTEAVVVSSGIKSLLDVPATMEMLETLGVPVLGYRTGTIPLFYSAVGGPAVSAQIASADDVARVAALHWQLGGKGIVVGNPPPASIETEELIELALASARDAGIAGQAVTPYVLAYLHEHSDGRTLAANRALIVANARLAGEIAAAYCAS